MASLEATTKGIFQQEGAAARLVCGALLALSMVGLPWAAGYLFRYAYRVKHQRDLQLPDWSEGLHLWRLGLHGMLVFAAWFALPILAIFVFRNLLTWPVHWFDHGGIGAFGDTLLFGLRMVGHLIFTAALTVFPVAAVAALFHYVDERSPRALLEFEPILGPLQSRADYLILPALAFAGSLWLFLPLLPLVLFSGFAVLIPLYQAADKSSAKRPSPTPEGSRKTGSGQSSAEKPTYTRLG